MHALHGLVQLQRKCKGTNPPAQLISFIVRHHVKATHENKFSLNTDRKASHFLLYGLAESIVLQTGLAQHTIYMTPSTTLNQWLSAAGVSTFHTRKIPMIICLKYLLYFRAFNLVRVATVYKSMPITLPKLFFHTQQELSAIWMSLTCDIIKV